MFEEPQADIKKAEEAAVEYHAQVAPDAVTLWFGGLNLLQDGFDPLQGRKTQRDEEHIQVALFVGAWNNLYWSFRTALYGYYTQALNLLRLPIEHWMAYWYLRSFPAEFGLFLDNPLGSPTFNVMMQKIEATHNTGGNRVVRAWIKRLHRFSHVDSAGVTLVMTPGQNGLLFGLGPQKDEELFLACAGEAIIVICMLLEAMDNVRQLMGYSPLNLKDYLYKVGAWQEQLAKS